MKKPVNGLEWIRFVYLFEQTNLTFLIQIIQLNCEELVEGYDNPVAGITKSDKESNTNDADDDDDDDDDGDSSKTKKNKQSSNKSISILSRTTSEFETCASEKSVDFDPVQGKLPIPSDRFYFVMNGFIFYSILQVRFATLATVRRRTAIAKSIRIRRRRSCAKRNNKFATAKKPQTPPVDRQILHRFFSSYIDLVCTFSRKTSTVQSRLLNATFIHNEQYSSTGTMYEQQGRRQNNMREILSNKSMQSPGHKVALFFSLFKRKKHVLNIDFVSVLAMALWPLQSIE